ncbi:ABC transporter ATP-binding protein [Isobaculum melis]|uniref:ABC-2 type transport system ATP-binding protein n=1 Tax=Isobaculum melis TaxID=142588 RepID=A0A1H9QLW5_9LACT|nr:ABC transporter ATP-binding protein [Isobaculum melis]SER61195.1 ABC-2 type transport system ATP-binding protein [Isobaculum melis]
MTEKKVLIRLDHIAKSFGSYQALKDINISVHEGEILGFLGPSGSGKTTTIKIITGQLKPTSGEAFVLGKKSTEINELVYEQIGIVSDNSGIYEKLTVYDNLRYFAKILAVKKERIDELLKIVGLYEHKDKPAEKLSKGQGQRLVLARAVLHNPKVLFLDEPTSGLDPTTAMAIHQLLISLKENGMAIFLTTHNMEEATKLCDHVALLNEGNIVEFGTPKEICLRYNEDKQFRLVLNNQEEITLPANAATAEQIKEWIVNDTFETIHTCEPTLEHVFVKVTGKELR